MVSKNDTRQAPWLLQRYLNGEIDLDKELTGRYRTMPMLSIIKLRAYDEYHAVATMTMQDGAAVVRVEVDLLNNVTQFALVFRSMLSLNFTLDQLGDSHRSHWLGFARREKAKPVFLWGAARWESDYVITVAHQHYTNIYAFSSNNFEGAARMTPDVTAQLLDWLEYMWKPGETADPTIPRLTTW